jgi:hypothetical protein
LEKKVAPKASRTCIDDDIDKTIAAFLNNRLRADHSTFSDRTIASGLALPAHDLPPKKTRMGNKLKSGSRTDGADHATALVPPTRSKKFMEVNNAEGNVASDAIERATVVSSEPALDPRFASSQSPESESDSNPGPKPQGSFPARFAKSVRPQGECPVTEGADSIEAHNAKMDLDPGLARSSEGIVTRCTSTAKTKSTPSVSSSGSSSTESPQLSILVHTLTAISSGELSPETRPAIAKDLEISEVHVESHGEGGSSDESSIEGEGDEEAVPLVKRARTVIAPPVPVHLLDQLTALIRGPENREPYKSILDEIPSRSETGNETSSEDLILDEEEDFSRQPSQKRMRVRSTVPLLSVEPESTSEDEDRASLPVYMDTSHEVPHRRSVSLFHFQVVSHED